MYEIIMVPIPSESKMTVIMRFHESRSERTKNMMQKKLTICSCRPPQYHGTVYLATCDTIMAPRSNVMTIVRTFAVLVITFRKRRISVKYISSA